VAALWAVLLWFGEVVGVGGCDSIQFDLHVPRRPFEPLLVEASYIKCVPVS
jgi:hypothetical protein